jgi:hypothetical protein
MVPGPQTRSCCVGPAFGALHIATAMYCTHLSLSTKWILRDVQPGDMEGILASILNGLKKPACIESIVSVRWLTLDRLGAALRPAQLTHPS